MTLKTYTFQSMTRGEQQCLVTRKQILQNTFTSSNDLSLSIKKDLSKSDKYWKFRVFVKTKKTCYGQPLGNRATSNRLSI